MKKIEIILRKEWAEVFRNRMVLFTVAFLPLLLTAIPLIILFTVGDTGAGMEEVSGSLPDEFNAYCPANLSGGDCFQVYLVSQFMLMFMIMPLAIPSAIASYSIVGEKATRSLEPLLATPITTIELLVGKGLAAMLPGTVATYGAFGIFAAVAFFAVDNQQLYAALLDARWLLAIFLVGPLMAILSVTVSIIVSSRVNDPRVAEQISMVVILPLMAVFFGQLAGFFVINRQLVLLAALVLVVVDAAMLYVAANLFQRENILTRWK